MATPEEQLLSLQAQMTALMAEMNQQSQRSGQMAMDLTQLRQENVTLRQGQETAGQHAAALQALGDVVQELKGLVKKQGGTTTLVDAKGLGRPQTFSNDQEKYLKWNRGVENYIVGIFGEEFRGVLEWALGCDAEIKEEDWQQAYGEGADDLDTIENLEHKVNQVYQALHALTEDESQDIVIGAGAGNGLEAWRKLGRRWDPVVAGRKRALLKQIISPDKCKLEDLFGCWERWEEQVRRYEKRRDDTGARLRVDQELKMTAFELLLPADLENHLILNKKRLSTYELQKEEIEGILESKIGAKIRELQIKAPKKKDSDAMDVDAFTKGGKSKGKGKGKSKSEQGKGKPSGKSSVGSSAAFQGYCGNCTKWGHKAADCWLKKQPGSKGQGGAGGDKGSSSGKGKGKGKQKGKKKGVGSFEDEPGGDEPEEEESWASLDCGALEMSSAELNSSNWLKFNYDTGAAVTAFPKGLVESSPGGGNGRSYRTATGELTSDEGSLRAMGLDENGNQNRVVGRIAGVHKVLVSASRSAGFGRNGWITKGGGYLAPDDSKRSRLVKKIMEKEAAKDKRIMKLYEENGVYNFYLKVGGKDGSLEYVPEERPELKSLNLEEMSREELVKLAQSGFTRQPKA